MGLYLSKSNGYEVIKFAATSQRAGTKLTVELMFTDPDELSYAMRQLSELKAPAKTKPRAKRLALPSPEDF